MDTLKNLMNQKLEELIGEKIEIEDFINDDKKSVEFIRKLLKDESFANEAEDNVDTEIAKVRARHSAVTFLLGQVFLPFYTFQNDMNDIHISEQEANLLWMWVSLYHDIGYFSKRIENEKLDYTKVFKYNLLADDSPQDVEVLRDFSIKYASSMAYTYDEILAYDKYARKFHENDKSSECIDHGILGGFITFDRLYGKLKNGNDDRKQILSKYSALTIAQHNFYKSNGIETDKYYREYSQSLYEKLGSQSEYRISRETPLLLFLCLIDTVEPVKKFSRSSNGTQYFKTLTVLSKIQASVSKNKLELDFTEFKKKISKKKTKLVNEYDKYFEVVCSLGEWTNFQVEPEGSVRLSIEYKENSQLSFKAS